MKDRIKQIRRELHLTQQAFADRIGVKRNSYANYETGRNIPIDAIILSICREFNVNEEWLRTGEGEIFIQLTQNQQITSFINSILASREDSFKKQYISMLSKLTESEWAALERIEILLYEKKD